MSYFFVQDRQLIQTPQPPAGVKPLLANTRLLLPPLIGDLHRNFQAWDAAGYSPGPVTPERVWIGAKGALAFLFTGSAAPKPLLQVGLSPDLAAWLVLLDKWMETFVVVARARSVWSVEELGTALPFLTPAFLPPRLVKQPPDNWARVAAALATAVADGPLAGESEDRHWQT
jgi:hypothetical protein